MERFLVVISLLIMSFMAVNVYGYSVYDLGVGTDIPVHDTRAIALGGSGVASGFSLFDSSLNPANLYFMDGNAFMMSHSLIKSSQNRAIPLWNFFDSYVDESTYARNEHFYNELSFGINYSLSFGDSKLAAAFIMRPIVNFGADYSEEVRNAGNSHNSAYPPILAKNFIESAGLLDSYSFLLNYGMALPFDDINISLGVEVSLLKGDYEFEERIHWTDTARTLATEPEQLIDVYSKTTNKMDGVGTKFGISSQVTERWRLGMSYSPMVSLATDLKKTSSTEEIFVYDSPDYVLPSKFRMGFLFRPRNPFTTNFQFDFETINYSEINKYYEDGYAFYVGMEHYIGRAVPLRLGFSHRSAKQDKSISLPIVSGGTSFSVIPNVQIDIAGEYGKREYSDLDLFPDGFYNHRGLWPNNHTPSDRGWESPDSVSESFWKVFTSLTIKF